MTEVPAEREIAGYRYTATTAEEGGFVIEYPDLPGCITQVDSAGEVTSAAEEILQLWLETASERRWAGRRKTGGRL